MKSCSHNQNRQRATAAALSVALLMTAHAGPGQGPSYVNFPVVSMGGVRRGQDAINGLGLRLPDVARAYGLTATELHLRLRADSSLAVDPQGRLLYTDPLTDVEVGDSSTQIPSPPVLLEGDPSTQIPSPPVLLEGDPSTQIPSPPVLLEGDPSTQIPSPPVLLEGDPSTQIPSPPVLLEGDPSTQIPSPPVLLGGTPSGQIPSPPVLLGGTPSGQIPSPPVLLGGTPSGQIPSPPVLLGGTPSGQIPSPPVLLGGTPSGQIPSPPVLLGGTPSGQIPSPPVLLGGTPSGQIPSPPVLLGGTPSGQIPSPPVLLGGTPSGQIPSPPVLLGGTPSGQIPSPPVLLGGNPSSQIPSPPVRYSQNGLIDPPTGQIPSPPTGNMLSGFDGSPSTQIPSPPVANFPGNNPSEQIPSPPVRVQENGLGGNPQEQIPSPPVRMTMNALETPQPVDAFKLHSRPGAKRTIFLDFNGEVMSGNAWTEFYNGGTNIVAPAYDTDGSPSTFSETERTRIIQIWQRVAEDYAPFDIDVTTELFSEAQLTRSNPADEYYGVRVLISPLSSYFGNYGGVSYLGTFNDVGDSWKPSLVFSDKLGANNDKNIAEAASHEAGHALGLSHDGVLNGASYFAGNGSGETGWAPIMGVGYSKNVTQWSKGEYASASNTQDDLAVMQNYGVTYRADDHGDQTAVASYLPLGMQLAASGIIERNTDVDMFAFVAGDGLATLTVAPQSRGPNLDVRATVYDSTGALVAVASSSTTLSAVFNLNLPAGTYFLAVQGEGRGSVTTGYSTYGSLGNYAITGTVANPVQPVAPVAVINPSAVVGTAPLAVTFGSLSFDSDGSVVAYDWNFGDGQTAQGAIVNHAYSQAGTYTAVLTITDDSGLTHTESLSIEVAPANVPPTAQMSVSTTSGTMPLAVVFNAAGSTDPDGEIVAYAWDFGDGNSAVGETVQHSFVAAGTYQVNLAVLDNLGAVSVASTTVVVRAVEQRVMRVETITTRTVVTPTGTTAFARVRVTNPSGSPLPGVTVTGRWAGIASNNKALVTDANGQVEIASKRVTTAGTLTFSITKMVLANYTYDPSLNQVSTATVVISAP